MLRRFLHLDPPHGLTNVTGTKFLSYFGILGLELGVSDTHVAAKILHDPAEVVRAQPALRRGRRLLPLISKRARLECVLHVRIGNMIGRRQRHGWEKREYPRRRRGRSVSTKAGNAPLFLQPNTHANGKFIFCALRPERPAIKVIPTLWGRSRFLVRAGPPSVIGTLYGQRAPTHTSFQTPSLPPLQNFLSHSLNF